MATCTLLGIDINVVVMIYPPTYPKCSVVCGDVVKHKLNVSLLLIIVVLHLQNVFLQK